MSPSQSRLRFGSKQRKPANCALVLAEAGQVSLVIKPENGDCTKQAKCRSTQGTYALLAHTQENEKTLNACESGF